MRLQLTADMDADTTGCIRRNFGSGEGVQGRPAISGKQRSDRSRTERMWEPNRSQESKGSGEQRDQESERGQKSQWAIEDKENGGPSLFLHQIIDFASVHFALVPASA